MTVNIKCLIWMININEWSWKLISKVGQFNIWLFELFHPSFHISYFSFFTGCFFWLVIPKKLKYEKTFKYGTGHLKFLKSQSLYKNLYSNIFSSLLILGLGLRKIPWWPVQTPTEKKISFSYSKIFCMTSQKNTL